LKTKLCDYGCGQKATYQFKNGKWCCSKRHTSCPEVRNKNSISSLNPSKETRQKLSNSQKEIRKGKTYEEIFGEEKAKQLKELHRINRMGFSNPMFGKSQSNDTKRKNRKAHLGEKNHFYGKHHTEESRRKNRESHLGKTLGSENPNWKGGVSCEPYCFEWSSKEFKNFIKDRDDNKCQNPYCHKNTERLAVHHINYIKKDCNINNLITLCYSCNGRANKNRKYWKRLYRRIIRGGYNFKTIYE